MKKINLDEYDIDINDDSFGLDVEAEPVEVNTAKAANLSFEWGHCIISAVVIVVILLTFVFRLVNIDGSSMLPTLVNSDKVIITNFFYEPEVGDIVVIPAGTGNDFIKSISKYTSMRKIVLASIHAPATPTDIIKFNKDKYCINILNLGFDAKIASNVDIFRKVPLISGSAKYTLAIFYTLLKNKNYRLKIRINDTVLKNAFTLVAIANGKFYGGGVCPEPTADTTDGILNVCAVTHTTLPQKLFLLPKYKKGKHEKINQLTHFTAQDIVVSSYKKIPVSIDGEVIYSNKIHAKVLPQAVNIVHIK